MSPPFKITSGFTPKKGRLPQHQVGEFSHLDRAYLMRDAVRDRRVDRVLGDIA